MEYFLECITPEVSAVVMTHASNVTGTIYDVRLVGEKCREMGVLFIVDAAQTAGVLPINIEEMNIDMLCFTGHKGLLGPQGTGGVAVRDGLSLSAFRKGGTGSASVSSMHPTDMPDVSEAGTLNTHGIAGLIAGVNFVREYGVSNIYKHEKFLCSLFRSKIKDIDGIKIYGDFRSPHVGIVTINYKDMDACEFSALLAEKEISVRSGIHCAPLAHKALGTLSTGAVRFSFGVMNSEDEVLQAGNILKNVLMS